MKKEFNFRYKSRFCLPIEEADFICAFARRIGADPDDALCVFIRMFARMNPGFARLIWKQAVADGRKERWLPP